VGGISRSTRHRFAPTFPTSCSCASASAPSTATTSKRCRSTSRTPWRSSTHGGAIELVAQSLPITIEVGAGVRRSAPRRLPMPPNHVRSLQAAVQGRRNDRPVQGDRRKVVETCSRPVLLFTRYSIGRRRSIVRTDGAGDRSLGLAGRRLSSR